MSDTLDTHMGRSSSEALRDELSGSDPQIMKLVEDLESTSTKTHREAAAELGKLARRVGGDRIKIANHGAIILLIDLLKSTDAETQENAATALRNLSLDDNNTAPIPRVEEIRVLMGRSGAISPLLDLMVKGTPRGKKNAVITLFNLSRSHENKARIVEAGAVNHLIRLLNPTSGLSDKVITAALANLASIYEGRRGIGQEGGIPVLVDVVELGSPKAKECAAAALLQLCVNSLRFCSVALQEGAVPPLVALSVSGTPRAKEKAQGLLEFLRSLR